MTYDQSCHESNPDQSARLGMGPLYRNGRRKIALITSEGKNGGHDNLHFDTGFQWAVRTPLWKLLLREDDHQEMMRQRLLSNEHTDIGHGTALYAIDQDPSETTNLLDDHPQVYDELRQVRQKWVKDVKNSHVQDRG